MTNVIPIKRELSEEDIAWGALAVALAAMSPSITIQEPDREVLLFALQGVAERHRGKGSIRVDTLDALAALERLKASEG